MKHIKKYCILWMVICMMLSINMAQPIKATELKGSTHAQQLYNYFYEKGYTPQAAAAIVGNVMWESCGGYGYLDFPLHTVEAATGEGIGMCQWSFERKYDFMNYCKSKGVHWTKSTLKIQADFLEKELKGGEHWLFPSYLYSSYCAQYKMSYKQFKNQTDIEKAVGGFCFNFERPLEYYARFSKRVEYAKKVYNKYYQKLIKPTKIDMDVKGDDVSITWKNNDAATKSKIQVYDKNWKLIHTHTTKHTNYKVKNLDEGIYYIRIGAMTPRDDIKYSDYHAFVIGNPSEKDKVMVTSITTKAIDYQTLRVNWNEVDNATKYVVYRSVNGGSYQKYHTTIHTSLKMNAKTGVIYRFKVKPMIQNKRGIIHGFMSSSKSGKTTLQGDINLSIKRQSNTTFTLKWNEIEGATSYLIYQKKEDGSYQKIKTVEDNTYTTNVLTPNTYSFKVKAARYTSKDQVYSKESNVVQGKSVFEKPTITLKKVSSRSIQISWKETDGTPYYSIYRKKTSKGTYQKIHSTNQTTYTDKGLEKDKTYYYIVRGYRIVNGYKYQSPSAIEQNLSL